MVEDGVGYRLGHLSVVPQEEEVLMEPGARLEVVEDNRFTAALCKEKDEPEDEKSYNQAEFDPGESFSTKAKGLSQLALQVHAHGRVSCVSRVWCAATFTITALDLASDAEAGRDCAARLEQRVLPGGRV